MPCHLYALLTWTTLRRLPLITPAAEQFLRRTLPKIADRYDVRVVETGIVQNHVHLIVELPPRLEIPRLLQGLKGASARIANRGGIMMRARLRWAEGYDLRSIGRRELPRAIRYVRNQSTRHPQLAIRAPS